MRRTHRTVHRVLWPLLAVVVMFGLIMALHQRPPPPAPSPAAQESPQ